MTVLGEMLVGHHPRLSEPWRRLTLSGQDVVIDRLGGFDAPRADEERITQEFARAAVQHTRKRPRGGANS
jgi:hypothetical protein